MPPWASESARAKEAEGPSVPWSPSAGGPAEQVQVLRCALWMSNAVAIVSLLFAGRALGKATGVPAGYLGVVMVIVGGLLVAVTIALGG